MIDRNLREDRDKASREVKLLLLGKSFYSRKLAISPVTKKKGVTIAPTSRGRKCFCLLFRNSGTIVVRHRFKLNHI